MESILKNRSLAVIIPVFNEALALEANFVKIAEIFEQDGIKAEFMFVDDGSKDQTWKVIEVLANQYSCVSGVKFSRNFGKEIALNAGLDAINADLYLFMDSDLQHPPRYVKSMIETMDKEKADIVEGIKTSRGKESLKYRIIAKTFYKLLKSITSLELDNSSDFKVINKDVILELRRVKERNLFFRGIVDWVGFKKVQFPFEVEERTAGKSSFSTIKLVGLALNAILSYTSKPLYITIVSSLIFLIFAVILGTQTLYNFIIGASVSGFSTVIVLLLIVGSMILMSMGIIGVYVARIYDEIKQRPKYIVHRLVGKNESNNSSL